MLLPIKGWHIAMEYLFSMILGIAVTLWIVSRGGKKKHSIKESAIKAKPETIQPVLPSEATFTLSPYKAEVPSMPVTKDSWFSIDGDNNLLMAYANELDTHRIRLDSAANTAISKFEQDYSMLNNHQLQIYRRIHQTKNILNRFPELGQRKISVNDIPDGFQVKLPPKPSYLRPDEIQKKYTIPINAISTTASRLILANGVRNPKNLLVVAVAFGAMAVKGKSNVSQLKRTLESTRGNVLNYGTSLMTTVGTLGEAHKELVKVSGLLKKSENDIIEVIGKVGTIDPQIKSLEQLSPDIRMHLSTLYFLTLQAEGHGKNAL